MRYHNKNADIEGVIIFKCPVRSICKYSSPKPSFTVPCRKLEHIHMCTQTLSCMQTDTAMLAHITPLAAVYIFGH